MLEGFEFNKNGKLSSTFSAPFTASIDRSTGTLTVEAPSFKPADMISSPKGATHFRFKASGAAIDFEGNTYSVTTSASPDLAISQEVQGPLHFSQHVTPGCTHPLFLILGIEFLQSVNGTQHPLNNGAFNAMAIVKVDGCAADEREVHASEDRAANFKQTSSRAMISFRDLQLMGMSSPLINTHIKTVMQKCGVIVVVEDPHLNPGKSINPINPAAPAVASREGGVQTMRTGECTCCGRITHAKADHINKVL